MDDKEKIKKALLDFANTLGIGDSTVREAHKKNIVGTLNESKEPVKTKPKAKKPTKQQEKQLTNLLSEYTESLGSTNKRAREQVKKQVMDAVNDQLHEGNDEQQVKQFSDYINDIDQMFHSGTSGQKSKKKPDMLSEELQRYVDDKVTEINNQVQQLKISNATTVDGGGGTVALQLVEGGRIEGPLVLEGQVKPESAYRNPDAIAALDGPALVVKQSNVNKDVASFKLGDNLTFFLDNSGNTNVIGDLNVSGSLNSGAINVIPGSQIYLDIIPKSGGAYTVGSAAKPFGYAHINNINTDTIYISSGITAKQLDVESLSAKQVRSHLIPSSSTLELGSPDAPWNDVHTDSISAKNYLGTGGTLNVEKGGTVGETLSVGGDLKVDQDAIITRKLTANTLSADHLYVTSNTTLSGNTRLGQDTTDSVWINGIIQSDLIPTETASDQSIGNADNVWDDLFVHDAHVNNDLDVLGDVIIGTDSNDSLSIRSRVTTNFVPSASNIVDLGADGQKWRTLYTRTVSSQDVLASGSATIDQNTTVGGNLAVTGTSTLKGDVHIMGDLRVDGSAYLSAGVDQNIYVGDTAQDSVIFNADVKSNITPDAADNTYTLGSPAQQWRTLFVRDISASNDVTIHGNTVIGSANTDTVAIVADITTNLDPQYNYLTLGNDTQEWNTLFVRDVSASNNLIVEHDTIIGTNKTDTIKFNSSVDSDVIPLSAKTYDLGSLLIPWKTLFTTTMSATSSIDVGEDATIHRNLAVSGFSTLSGDVLMLDDATVQDDLTVERNLAVSGTSTLSGDVHIYGDLRVDGNAYLSAGTDGNIFVGDKATDNVVFRADVNSDILPNNSLTYTLGTSAQQWNKLFVHDISASGDTIVNENLSVSGNTYLGSDYTQDTVTFDSRVRSNLDPFIDETYDLGSTTYKWRVLNVQDVSATNNLFVGGDSVIGDSALDHLYVNAEVNTDFVPVIGIKHDLGHNTNQWQTLYVQDISASRDTTIDRNLAVSGYTTLSGDVVAYDDVTVQDNLTVEDNLAVSGYTTLSGDVVAYDNMTVQDNFTVSGSSIIGDSTQDTVIFNAEVDSDFVPTAGISHDLGTGVNQWQTLYVQDISASRDTTIDRNLAVSGYTTLSGDVVAYDNMTVQDNLVVSGTTDLEDQVHAHSQVTIDGDLITNANVTIGSDDVDHVTFNAQANSSLIPNTSRLYDLGTPTLEWKNIYNRNTYLSNNLTVSGNTILGDDFSDLVTVNSQIDSNLVPVTGVKYDLGSGSQTWNTLYIKSVSATDDVVIDDTLTVSGSASVDQDMIIGLDDTKQLTLNSKIDGDLVPTQDQVYHIGTPELRWTDIHNDNTYITENLTVSGNTTLGYTDVDTVTIPAEIDSHVIPVQGVSYDLGSSTQTWRNLYVRDISATNTATIDNDLIVRDTSYLRQTVIGATSADDVWVNALVNTDVVPEYGEINQQLTGEIVGHDSDHSQAVGGTLENVFESSINNYWSSRAPDGDFVMTMDIILSIPIDGSILDQYIWKYNANSVGGVRTVHVRDAATATWYMLAFHSFSGAPLGAGNQIVTGIVSETIKGIDIDGVRFKYEKSGSAIGGYDFEIQYFQLTQANGNMVDFENFTIMQTKNIGRDVKPWGTIYNIDTNIVDTLTVSGDVVIGKSSANSIKINSDIDSNLNPDKSNTYTLGTPFQQWSQTYTNNLSAAALSANGLIYPTQDGDSRDAVITDGIGNLRLGSPQRLELDIINEDGVTLQPGDPVYAAGAVGSSGVVRVARADCTNSFKMPAIGLVKESVESGKTGTIMTNGVWDLNLTGFTQLTVGKTLYVGQNGLVSEKPTGDQSLLQNMGQVLKCNNTGTVLQTAKITSLDRSNDTPILSNGYVFYGQNDETTQRTLTGAIYDQPVIKTQELHTDGPFLSGGVDLKVQLDTLSQRIEGLYNYSVSDYDNNTPSNEDTLIEFIANEYPSLSSSLSMGDTMTLTNGDMYILTNNIGDTSDDWLLVNLKPLARIYDTTLTHGKAIDSFFLSRSKSAKYVIEVTDQNTGDVQFTELSMVTNGTNLSIVPYGMNYTSTYPFVEFTGAVTGSGGSTSVSLVILQASGFSNIDDCVIRATRVNL